jgi:hypothetical protein
MKAFLSTSIIAALVAGCVADSQTLPGTDGDSDSAAVGEAAYAISAAATAQVPERDPNIIDARVVGVRTPWEWQHPRWTLYSVRRRYARFDDIAASPADGHGPPLLLSFDSYHYHGDAYIDELLTSGYLSVIDLAAITSELERHGAALPAAPREVLLALVNPSKRRGRCASCSEEGAPISFPGGVDDPSARGLGGPPPIDQSRGGGGFPANPDTDYMPLTCGGEKRRGDPKDCSDYDMRETGATKLGKRFRAWFADSWTCVATCTIAVYKLAESTQVVCAFPGARAFGYGIPCTIAALGTTMSGSVVTGAVCDKLLCPAVKQAL